MNIAPNVGSGWAKLERRRIGDGTNGAKGTTYNARGKRLFFWEDLLTNSTYGLSESVTGVGTSSGTGYSTAADGYYEDCVWLYVDENGNAGADTFRDATLTITFNRKDGGSDTETYTIRQWDLLVVEYPAPYDPRTTTTTPASIPHYIERYEEYLHAFDSKDEYTDPQHDYTAAGMPWGLVSSDTDQINLSYDYRALYLISDYSFSRDPINKCIDNNITPKWSSKYDFYSGDAGSDIPADVRNLKYNGQTFTAEIITDCNHNRGNGSLSGNIWVYPNPGTEILNSSSSNHCPIIDLDTKPNSIFQYVLQKNKVRVDGNYYKVNLNWYVPSTDEMETIVMDKYVVFREFQDNFYWSSQPSNIKCYVFMEPFWGVFDGGEGYFFHDNIYRARATKVSATGTVTPSGPANISEKYRVYYHIWSLSDRRSTGYYLDNYQTPWPDPQFEAGNLLRETNHRVRAAYAPSSAPTVSFKMN